MRTHRFFCQTPQGEQAVLDAGQSRHLGKVLRLQVGDSVQVFDGKGLLAEATIERIGRDETALRLHKTIQVPPKASGRVILAVSLAKGERFDWLVEKCTELDADHIAAVHYDRTVKMGKASSLDRYAKIALSAAKQCGRLHLPTLSGPASFERTLKELQADYPAAALVFGDANGSPMESVARTHRRGDSIVCIGPEGGFSDNERRLLADAGARPVCVNPNILRVETAAVAFAAALAALSCPPAAGLQTPECGAP